MAPTGKLVAKCAAVAALATGLMVLSQFSERKTLPSWTATAQAPAKPVPGAMTPVESAAAMPAPSTQPEAAAAPAAVAEAARPERPACAEQVWPNIKPECITGRAEPARREVRVADRPEAQPVILRPTPAVAAPVAAALLDPSTTGSLSAPGAGAAQASLSPTLPAVAPRRDPRRAAKRTPARVQQADFYAPAPRRLSEPVQFRLADRN